MQLSHLRRARNRCRRRQYEGTGGEMLLALSTTLKDTPWGHECRPTRTCTGKIDGNNPLRLLPTVVLPHYVGAALTTGSFILKGTEAMRFRWHGPARGPYLYIVVSHLTTCNLLRLQGPSVRTHTAKHWQKQIKSLRTHVLYSFAIPTFVVVLQSPNARLGGGA